MEQTNQAQTQSTRSSNITETASSSGNRNEMQFNAAGFPQLPIIGYGIVNTDGGTTAFFEESDIVHQPSSWAVSRLGTGLYQITHNLGHMRWMGMAFVAFPLPGGQVLNSTRTATQFNIISRDIATGLFADTSSFLFIVWMVP